MRARAIPALGIAALLALAPGSPAAADPRSCTVAAIDGPEALGWHAGEWAWLRAGQAVAAEAKIATGGATRVKVACGDGTVVTIGSATEVNLESLVGPAAGVVIQLLDGIVGLLAPGGTQGFVVRTPLAIASVRSTEWLVEHSGTDGSAVFVRAGRVRVAPRAGGSVTLGPGEGVTVPPEGPAGAVKAWGEARIARSTVALGFDWQ